MSKKFTLTLAMALMLFANAINAQTHFSLEDHGDIPVTAPEAGKYYVIETHSQTGSTFWMFDNGTNISADDFTTGVEGMKFVWTITEEDGNMYIQNVSTGKYINIEGTSNGGATSTKENKFPIIIEYAEDESGSCAFKNESGQYIDMGYSGKSPCTWGGGVTGSRVMTIYEAVLTSVTDEDIAKSELVAVVDKYGKHVPGYLAEPELFDIGTEIGQYNVSEKVYEDFISSMNMAINIVIGEVEAPSVEEIRTLIATIETLYQEITSSYVELTIADGNYRIVSAMEWTKTIRTETGEVDENGDPVVEVTYEHPIKAMYATMEDEVRWATLDSTDCQYLWKLTNNSETGFIKVMNIATDGVIDGCSQSQNATISKTSETEMYFEYKGRDNNGNIKIAMRPSAGGNYAFLHANGHNNGTGEGNTIVGWLADEDATQWILCPVSDEEVNELIEAFAPIKNHDLLVSMYQELITEGENLINIATDQTTTALITNAEQLSSPFGENDLYPDKKDGGDISALIDGDISTYFHTAWGGGTVEPGTHYIVTTFNEPVAGNMMVTLTRRNNAANDHVSKMDVYGSDDIDGEYTLVAQLEFPYNAQGETVKTDIFNVETPYTAYKFVVTETAPTDYNRGYFHMAEFQIYSVNVNETSQLIAMGDVAQKLIAAIETAKGVDPDELTMDEYEALKEAYDAANAIFVDPAPLREAINNNRNATANIVIGENPGFWSADSEAGSFVELLEEAEAYDKAGKYTQEQTDNYIQGIKTGVSNIMASANKVESGKWYAIRFASEEMYDEYGWDKGNVVNETLGDLYDNYVAPANVVDGELTTFENMDDVAEGTTLRFVDENLVPDMNQIAFRFISQGDSAYVLQHNSGLFVSGANAGSSITLGTNPAIFNVSAVGLGKVLIHTRNLEGADYGDAPVYLHAQNAGHSLVTWTATEIGSNSALFIESVDDNVSDVSESFVRKVLPNSMRIWCYPAGYTVSEGTLYEYKGVYVDDEGSHYAFNQIEAAAPGQPVLYVNGDIAYFNKEDEEIDEYITLNNERFAPKAGTENGMHGTYTYEWIDEGLAVIGGGDIAKWGNQLVYAEGEDNTDCTRDVSACTGYIVPSECVIEDGEYDLVLTIAGDNTGIGGINAGTTGNDVIYNLAGQRVIKAEKGIFIINGKKVSVK